MWCGAVQERCGVRDVGSGDHVGGSSCPDAGRVEVVVAGGGCAVSAVAIVLGQLRFSFPAVQRAWGRCREARSVIVFDDGGGDNAVWVYGCMCRLIACFGSPAFVHVCVCVLLLLMELCVGTCAGTCFVV